MYYKHFSIQWCENSQNYISVYFCNMRSSVEFLHSCYFMHEMHVLTNYLSSTLCFVITLCRLETAQCLGRIYCLPLHS
jgi:hypothetical protein